MTDDLYPTLTCPQCGTRPGVPCDCTDWDEEDG